MDASRAASMAAEVSTRPKRAVGLLPKGAGAKAAHEPIKEARKIFIFRGGVVLFGFGLKL